MFIIKKGYEEHKDLIEFQTKYENRVNEFLNSSPETRVIFLNADFGWGKTTFIKNNLKVKEKDIYSPWLNKSNNYLEDIYYQVLKKNKGLLSSISLFISFILFFITMLFSSITSILIELNKNNSYECYIKNFKVICSTNDNLLILLKWIILIVIIVIAIVAFFIFLRPIPIINFFKKENGKYYENKLIKKILKEVDKVLVIEDIDRIDDIEEILIVANKISEYACKEKIDKYILITGDYLRMIRRIGEPTIYDTNYFNLATYRNKGAFVVEKIISLRIDFSTMQKRIDTLLEEKNLKLNLTTIEYDEIISFIKNKFLSIRFFIKFLDKYKDKLSANNNLYYLLLKYYQEEKFFNIDNSVISNSIYNIDNFPNCLNDIEMLLQKNI